VKNIAWNKLLDILSTSMQKARVHFRTIFYEDWLGANNWVNIQMCPTIRKTYKPSLIKTDSVIYG
jgi:hypothetical protein